MTRVTSMINAVLAAWLMLSVWVLRMNTGPLVASTLLTGAVVLAVSSLRLNRRRTAALRWLNAVAGTWLVISAWMLGYSNNDAAAWNCMLVGALIAGIATSSISRSCRRGSWGPRASKRLDH